MVKLYHYTNLDGVQGILNAGFIKAKWPHAGQARMPFGVYLTELSPDSPPNKLILNNFDDGEKRLSDPEFISKVKFYFEFNSEDLAQVYRRKTTRNEWVCPDDIKVDPEHVVYGIAGGRNSFNSSELADCMHRLIAKNVEIIDSLKSIINEINPTIIRIINNSDRKTNVVKTLRAVGAVGAVGVAMLIGGAILAPLTAGASLGLMAATLAPTISVPVIAVENSLINYFQSKEFDEKIKIAEEHNSIAKELKPMLQNLNAIVTDFQKLGMSEEEAFGSTLIYLVKGFIQLGSKGKTAIIDYRNAKKVFEVFEIAKNLSKTAGIGKNIGSIDKTIGIGVGSALNLANVAYDIYDTVKGWKSSHPKIKDITILTEKLNSEIKQFEIILEVLEQ